VKILTGGLARESASVLWRTDLVKFQGRWCHTDGHPRNFRHRADTHAIQLGVGCQLARGAAGMTKVQMEEDFRHNVWRTGQEIWRERPIPEDSVFGFIFLGDRCLTQFRKF
jgi:hypothetical protein